MTRLEVPGNDVLGIRAANPGPFTLGGVEIVPVPLLHGLLPVLGFRIGDFAYLTDCNRIPEGSWPTTVGHALACLPRTYGQKARKSVPFENDGCPSTGAWR